MRRIAMAQNLRGICVVDVGYTNTKAILFSPELKILAERKMASAHIQGPDYKTIDPEPLVAFLRQALPELDQILPIDCIVPCAHGAAMALLKADGSLAFPVMDYASQPPPEIVAAYQKIQPPFAEVYCDLLPMSLTHAVQIFWQARIDPQRFAEVQTIITWIQYVAFRLCGVAAMEISSIACQTQLVNVNTGRPSSLARREGWGKKYAPLRKAWEVLGKVKPEFKLHGEGRVVAGVHDSNANYLRYLAGDTPDFSLLSTGTWSICFNASADVSKLDPRRDTNANTSVMGKAVASSRFFAGKELEVLAAGADAAVAQIDVVQVLIDRGTFALPSFTYSSGPVPGSGQKGKIIGPPPAHDVERASLAALYCAQMVSLQLDAVQSQNTIIVDGPFSQNKVFLEILAALRAGQAVKASALKDGTAAGAAILARMSDGKLPRVRLELTDVQPALLKDLSAYDARWKTIFEEVG
jgi:sugar (pentulose or hexulose) kinase